MQCIYAWGGLVLNPQPDERFDNRRTNAMSTLAFGYSIYLFEGVHKVVKRTQDNMR
jgi:hypothetical protein